VDSDDSCSLAACHDCSSVHCARAPHRLAEAMTEYRILVVIKLLLILSKLQVVAHWLLTGLEFWYAVND